MKLLLDTCVLLWMCDETKQLSHSARAALEDGNNDLVVHQVSSLEIQIKYSLGKLPLTLAPHDFVSQAIQKNGLQYQILGDEEIWHLAKLPPLHSDPFDRLLISYALCEGLKMVTPDPQIHRYPVPVIW